MDMGSMTNGTMASQTMSGMGAMNTGMSESQMIEMMEMMMKGLTRSQMMDMMMMMRMDFYNSIHTHLWSYAWTPSSVGTYAGTCIFLIALSMILRCLFVFKHRLEARWARQALDRRFVVVARPELDSGAGRTRSSSASERRVIAQTQGGGGALVGEKRLVNERTAVLTTNGVSEHVRIIETLNPGLVSSIADQPWRISVDFPRALLVGIMVAVGYLLMLAVMTYNIGYFISVLSGAFLGELLVGRLHPTGMDHMH